jgi:[ribosomal protein S18]-alanine N-acetyltransferase
MSRRESGGIVTSSSEVFANANFKLIHQRNVRHEQPVGHTLLEILEHAGLSSTLIARASPSDNRESIPTMPSRLAHAPVAEVRVRKAERGDIGALIDLEHRVFATDRLSRRSLRRFLQSPAAEVIVAEHGARLAGNAIVLFRPRSLIARLYSIAVAPHMSGRGIAPMLLAAAEAAAVARDCRAIRLEVHVTNHAAVSRYRKSSYREFGRIRGYYDDGGDALRFEKRLVPNLPAHAAAPPYFPTADFRGRKSAGGSLAEVASASSASLTRSRMPQSWWLFSTAYRHVVATGADGADSADDGGSVLDPRAYPDRPGPRSPLAGEGYFDPQHAKERLRTAQPASEGAGISWPIAVIVAGKRAGGTQKL